MPEVTTDDGVRLHYIEQGSGPLGIIYLHAMAGDAGNWRDLWPTLDGSRFRHVAIDLRGHGRSVCAPRVLTNEQLARDVLTVADATGMDRFAIAGQSLGGKVAMRLTAMTPERVAALVLLGTPGPGFVPVKREEVADFFATYHDLEVTRAFFNGWFKVFNPRVHAWLEAFSRYPDWLLNATAEMAIWTDIRAEIAGVRCPALVIAGADDPVYGPSYQHTDVLPYLTGAKMDVIRDCGHGLVLEQPAAIASRVEEFLSGVR